MKRTLSVLLVVALLVGIMVPSFAFAMSNPNSRFVKTGNGKPLNVRSGPSSNDEVFFKLPYGTHVEVIDTQGDWCLIRPYDEALWKQAHNSTNMWVMKSFLVTKNPGPWKKPEPVTPTYEEVEAALRQIKPLANPVLAEIVTSRPSNYVHLRMVPSTNASYSAQYLAGERILILAQSNTWSQVIDVADGHVGYVLTNNVNPLMVLDEDALADETKVPVVYDNNLTLNMVFPAGYQVVVEENGIYKLIRMTSDCDPEITLLVCPDDEYADLVRLNDMEEADQEDFVLSLMEDYHDANVTWLKTEHDTDVVLLNENNAAVDYAELVTLYHGYLIDVQLVAKNGEVVTGDNIATAMKMLSDMEFVYTIR